MRRTRIMHTIVRGAIIFTSVLAFAGAVGWRRRLRSFVRRYYVQAYAPIRLAAADVGDYPPEQQLRDVPWIATDVPACQSTSLQMIAAQHGARRSRAAIDFLMAFIYGFSAIPWTGAPVRLSMALFIVQPLVTRILSRCGDERGRFRPVRVISARYQAGGGGGRLLTTCQE